MKTSRFDLMEKKKRSREMGKKEEDRIDFLISIPKEKNR